MSNQTSSQRDRIYIGEAYHALYEDLITESLNSPEPFKTMKDVFLLAVLIGYRSERRLTVKNKKQIFSWAQLSPQEDVPILRGLAIAETGEVDVLRDRDTVLTIAEEYANGGILEIKSHVADVPGNRIGNLVGLLQQWMPIDASPRHENH